MVELLPEVLVSEPLVRFFFVLVLEEEVDGWLLDELLEAEGCEDDVLLEADGAVDDDWLPEAPWFRLDDELMSVVVWLAEVELLVVLLPLPTFTPGLTLALAFKLELFTPTFALRSTFGFTLSEGWLVSERVVLDGVELVEPEMPLVAPDLLVVALPETLPEAEVVPFETPAPVVELVLGAT